MNNRLKELRDKIKSAGYVSIVAPGRLTAWLHLGTEGLNVDVHDLVKLAQLAVLPGDAEPTAGGGVTHGECTALGNFTHGTLYETLSGRRRVILPDGREMDLSTGIVERYNHGALGREIILPAPVTPPQEPEQPSLDERAWQFIEGLAAIGYSNAAQLLAERAAATQGTAGG